MNLSKTDHICLHEPHKPLEPKSVNVDLELHLGQSTVGFTRFFSLLTNYVLTKD